MKQELALNKQIHFHGHNLVEVLVDCFNYLGTITECRYDKFTRIRRALV